MVPAGSGVFVGSASARFAAATQDSVAISRSRTASCLAKSGTTKPVPCPGPVWLKARVIITGSPVVSKKSLPISSCANLLTP
ncbi:MAG: hypothetical protein BWY79_00923 [Actinobacteria bacterium ADurb.Bin444]|nr:MAG: hypothetical protein BWY79_00923 [Actinobacteria bacterium ADurb.Bin444]